MRFSNKKERNKLILFCGYAEHVTVIKFPVWFQGGGSEVLQNPCAGQVITSLAFHPCGDVLAFATMNYIYYWDWSKGPPFAYTKTSLESERVRWVLVLCMQGHIVVVVTGVYLWVVDDPNTAVFFFYCKKHFWGFRQGHRLWLTITTASL